MDPATVSQLGSLIRHLLSALGGFLIAHGIYAGAQDDFVDQLAPVATQVAVGAIAWFLAHAGAWMRNRALHSQEWKLPTSWCIACALLCGGLTSCGGLGGDEREFALQQANFRTMLEAKHAAHAQRMAGLAGREVMP